MAALNDALSAARNYVIEYRREHDLIAETLFAKNEYAAFRRVLAVPRRRLQRVDFTRPRLFRGPTVFVSLPARGEITAEQAIDPRVETDPAEHAIEANFAGRRAIRCEFARAAQR